MRFGKNLFLRSVLVCSMLGAIIFGLNLEKIDRLPLSGAPLHFDSNRAYSEMKQLAKGFPNRTTWSESRKKAALWLKDEFKKLGYQPKGMYFSEVIAGKRYTDLENVYAEKRGTKYPDEIIVVSAHYDIADTTVEGAMDDAAGVGVMLELARVFAQEETERTLIFLATDSEEFGAFWGARAFVKRFPRTQQIIAVANVDFVAPEKQASILMLCDGLQKGYTPLWLRELALDSLRSVSGETTRVLDMDGILEFASRALQIPPADHGAFLAAGIPAFNWVGQSENFAYEMAHYLHTPNDVAEALRPESFQPFGEGIERLIHSINALNELPQNLKSGSYWKVNDNFYIEGWANTVLHILAFIPFLVFSLAKFSKELRKSSKDQVRATLRNEAKKLSILLGSMLVGYVILLMLPVFKIITQYETFPATQKSLLLYTPNFVAILIVIGSIIAIDRFFRRTFAHPEDHEGNIALRHALHFLFLAFIIFLAFLKNSYLAVLLLLPPAYFWMALRHGPRHSLKHDSRGRKLRRIINGLLLLGGSITLVILAIVMGTVYDIGVVYWYIFLAAAYGLISAYSVVLFLMALAVMISLFRNYVIASHKH